MMAARNPLLRPVGGIDPGLEEFLNQHSPSAAPQYTVEDMLQAGLWRVPGWQEMLEQRRPINPLADPNMPTQAPEDAMRGEFATHPAWWQLPPVAGVQPISAQRMHPFLQYMLRGR